MLFIHVPKTGGSTITYELKQHHEVHMISNCARPGYQATPQHLHCDPLTELFRSDEFVYAFVVVRHPVDRICSAYNWNQRKRSIKVPFWIWLRTKLYKSRNSPYLDDNHLRPQVDFPCHNAEVFRLEDGLEKVFRRLSEITGEKYADNLEIRKQSTTRPASVSNADRRLIRKFYADDFTRFGYELNSEIAYQ